MGKESLGGEQPGSRKELSDVTKEFLLHEYGYFSESFWRNEEAGEKRVNFFVTLVTAVLAALVALATRTKGDKGTLVDHQVLGITLAACLSLLAVGGRHPATPGISQPRDR